MTRSYFSDSTNTGGQTDAISAADWRELWKRTFQNNAAVEGPIADALNNFATTGTASPLSVATGAAIINGDPYIMDSSASLAVTTPVVGTTGGAVVLTFDYTANTVGPAIILNTDGNSAIPSVTQADGTTWQIKIYTFTITTGGVITLTDVRRFCEFGSPLFRYRIADSSGDWNAPGTTVGRPSMGRMAPFAVQWTGAAATSGTLDVTLPAAWNSAFIVLVQPTSGRVLASGVALAGNASFRISWTAEDAVNKTSINFQGVLFGSLS